MIVLDTNVVLEPMKPNGNPSVMAWLDSQSAETLYLTATSLSELLVGVGILPEGRRKAGLGVALAELVTQLFGDRILLFDQEAAVTYASLISRARASGRHIAVADGQIAAIAAVRGFAVATRDTAPFEAAGVPIINPFERFEIGKEIS
jgi:predicted nucleic acid-binding protein